MIMNRQSVGGCDGAMNTVILSLLESVMEARKWPISEFLSAPLRLRSKDADRLPFEMIIAARLSIQRRDTDQPPLPRR